ncbi:MAG TPA: hypothetical protein VFF09_05130, partial [archaeon]|nr:hypothetical protein [archaeon]
MKKSLFIIAIALLLTLAQMNFAHAARSDGYIHQNHFYAVSFDGEGDAIVRAQIGIENTTDRAIKYVDLEIPGQIVVYKAVQEVSSYYGAEYNYRDYYYPQQGTPKVIDYTKTLTSEATILRLELKEAVEKQGVSTIVLFYRIPRYALKDFFGNYSFDFKTIIDKDAILIENLRVAVNVQEGLSLKGGEAKVDYRSNASLGFVSGAAMSEMAGAGVDSKVYRDYYYGIQNAQGLVKTASSLDPFESFHVKGNYGENWIALYFLDIAFWLIVLGIGIVLAVKLGRKALEKLSPKKGKQESGALAQTFIASIGSALGIIVAMVLAFALASALNGFSYSLQAFSMLIIVLGLIVSAGLLFLPALYISSKNGMLYGA